MEADPLMPAIGIVPTLAQRRAGQDAVLEAADPAVIRAVGGSSSLCCFPAANGPPGPGRES